VRAWFDTRLEDTRPLVKDANEHLRGRDALRADVPRIGPGPDAKFCGTALDLLVRMTLRSRGWSAAPSRGALRLQYTHGMDRAVEIAGETADRIAALEPATRSADEVDGGEVVPLRALLARYEQAGRSEFAAGQVAGRLRGVRPTLAATIDTRPSLMSTCIAARRTRTSVAFQRIQTLQGEGGVPFGPPPSVLCDGGHAGVACYTVTSRSRGTVTTARLVCDLSATATGEGVPSRRSCRGG
jgi:hypothetical protein